MISDLLNREIRKICRSVVRFLDVSVSRAMGCFFGCFRVKDDHRSRISNSTCPKFSEPVVSDNRLASLFSNEENEESGCNNRENLSFGSPQIDKALKDEAKFLKACGTLPQTPDEIRKASEKLKGSPSGDQDSEPSKFHSWLPNTSIKKLQLDRECNEPPTPVKLFEDWGKEAASSELTPGSCNSNVQNSRRSSITSIEGSDVESANTPAKFDANQTDNIIASASPGIAGTNFQCRNKSVRFECDSDVSSSKGSSSSQNSKKYETPGNQSVSKASRSPYPTPLKLSDDMQTPGTMYPANENYRIRSQYVYSVSNPVGSVSQWNALKEESSDSHQLSVESRESLEQSVKATPISEVGTKETSVGNEMKGEASLNVWLKPVTSTNDDNENLGVAGTNKNPYFGRTPGDRPIIGMVAAHWNADDTTEISPKWWDGNGIPNSTTKYKEDQKVSWHATPFEERLEKALSEESFISQRKQISSTPVAFDDNEESDSALSQLRPSTNSKSVVSF